MELQNLIKRTLLAANYAEWLGLPRTQESLLSLVSLLVIENELVQIVEFPLEGDNFTGVIDLTANEKFTIH